MGLSLDKEELYRYIATDQVPISGAVNHHDLGAHLDHAKLQPRGFEYHQTSKLPVESRFDEQFKTYNKELCDSPRTTRIKSTAGNMYVIGKWNPWKKFEFRKDEPI